MTNSEWNDLIVNLSGAHFLQTGQWAEVKKPVGWKAERLTWMNERGDTAAAAQVLFRSTRLFKFGPSVTVAYIPRGPMVDWTDEPLRNRVLKDLQTLACERKAIFLKIDPELVTGYGVPGTDLDEVIQVAAVINKEIIANGWRFSPEQIQFRNTVQIDLTGSEEDWLKRMKQKTRYNIRLAERNGVSVRIAEEKDLPGLYLMYAETAARDGFIIRSKSYYLDVWTRFIQAGQAHGLIAEVDGKPVAGLFLFWFGRSAWYVYGMSRQVHREKMPNYLLQWEAMKLAKEKGCVIYDMWGAPDKFDSTDSMSGVFRFKEGLGGKVVRTIGAWDYPCRPLMYFLYQWLLPRLLDVTRFFRRRQIKQEII